LIETIPTGPREWRKFGLLFMTIFFLVAAYLFWKGKPVWWVGVVCAGIFGGAGLLTPSLLRVPHKLWMQFAGILGWVNTRVLLSIFFFIVLTPVGVVMRLFGRDPLARRLSKESATYWEKREGPAPDRSRFENLF
jgi:hypothetical protein